MLNRLSRRDRTFFWAALGAAAILASVGIGLTRWDEVAESPDAPAHRATPASVPTQAAASADADPADKVQERASPVVGVQTQQALHLDPPYIIVDGLTFAAGPITVRLGGLEGPPARAACRDENRHVWACGLQARAALNNHTRKRRVACTVTSTSVQGIADALCTVEGEGDLGRKLVEEGWARPTDSSLGSYLSALDDARRNKRGLWNGEWSVAEFTPTHDAGADHARGLDLRPTQAGN
jgi:endonuclease YncB( thermonuclease family)